MQFNLKQTRTEREIRNQTYTQIDRWEMQFKTDRQTDRHAHTHSHRLEIKHTHKHTNRQGMQFRQTHTHTYTHTHKPEIKLAHKQTSSQTDRGRVKHTHPEGPVTVLESLVVFAQLDQCLSAVGVQHGVVPHFVDSLSQPHSHSHNCSQALAVRLRIQQHFKQSL